MKRHLIISTLTLLIFASIQATFAQAGQGKVANSSKGHLVRDDVTQGRDLSMYGKGAFHVGAYAFVHGISEEQTAKDRTGARAFIWEHWKSRKPGYAMVTWHEVDAVSTAHIFIEPDKAGSWQLIWRFVRHSGEIGDWPLIRTIERRRGADSDSVIAPEKELEPESYRLFFIDDKGHPMGTIL